MFSVPTARHHKSLGDSRLGQSTRQGHKHCCKIMGGGDLCKARGSLQQQHWLRSPWKFAWRVQGIEGMRVLGRHLPAVQGGDL